MMSPTFATEKTQMPPTELLCAYAFFLVSAGAVASRCRWCVLFDSYSVRDAPMFWSRALGYAGRHDRQCHRDLCKSTRLGCPCPLLSPFFHTLVEWIFASRCIWRLRISSL